MTTQFAMTPPANDDGCYAFRSRARAWFRRFEQGEPATADAPHVPAGPSPEVVREHLRGIIEALLFASEKPMTIGDICKSARAERAWTTRDAV